ncbi:MAG TPA: gephyrin-like molybdotransferase Glp [Acidobacteriaceae bacterium]|nr:gephyrin-like molybdotransferase Glp [Acidobacteriaceae bacterium]
MQRSSSSDVLPGTPAALISFAEACSIVSAQAAAIQATFVSEAANCELIDALGRRLAVALIADRDQPPFPRVTRDGFAVRAKDVNPDTFLRVIGQVRAGEAWPAGNPPIAAGEAVEIMTGAPLPAGADAVLMVEHAQESDSQSDTARCDGGAPQRRVRPLPGRTLKPGENVVPEGSEARKGDILLKPGCRLGPEHLALAASCGFLSVPVFPKPNVAILATGDELVDALAQAAAIQPHQIYDSNSHALVALVQQAGGIALRQRPARDERDDLASSIWEGLQAAPLLLMSGGVSMGKFDLVEEVLAGMGAEFFFTGVKMQPGKPVVFGRVPSDGGRPQRYFFGLPGNPVSTMVTFRVFVEPLLAALAGERNWQPNIAVAKLVADFHAKPGLTRFLPAHLDTDAPLATVNPVRTQGSGDLAANALANCYLIVPEECDLLSAGEMVRVLLRSSSSSDPANGVVAV